MTSAEPLFVVSSAVEVPVEGASALEEAFAARLGEVESAPGFVRLEVWRQEGRQGSYVMVSWWRQESDFRAYMRSDAHRRSHARVLGAPWRPRGTGVTRYRLVAE
ncbi:MAG: antibiotic biosynthesis monooxygenase [Actinomycetota bacterium]|nr:antibiotic biosynthesis monooxygenase [Actinomycetota bacterium]